MRWIALTALVLVAAGCGGSGGSTQAGPPTVTVTVAEETIPVATVTTPAKPSACDPSELLPAVKGALGDAVARVEVVRCRNGYARASAIPSKQNMETADVLLRRTGGAWTIVDFGTSIGCEEETLPPAPAPNRRACAALGYPQPAVIGGAAFQLPSKNIGCLSAPGVLRCDILSGLKPKPKKEKCPYDWVGITMEATGPAEPQCAGDTVYDASAPVLGYGDIWHRGSFWCRSDETGLLCVNKDPEGSFELAREGWTAG
jgi:hypothetical protein